MNSLISNIDRSVYPLILLLQNQDYIYHDALLKYISNIMFPLCLHKIAFNLFYPLQSFSLYLIRSISIVDSNEQVNFTVE